MNRTIEQEETQGSGSLFVKDKDKKVAEMTYSYKTGQRIVIEHTFVDPMLRGEGMGRALLEFIIDKARREHLLIVPLCSFARSVFERDPSLQDVLSSDM